MDDLNTREHSRIQRAVDQWEKGNSEWLTDDILGFVVELMLELLIRAQKIYRATEQTLANNQQSLNMTDFRILGHLILEGADSVAHTSHRLDMPRTTISYSFKKMEKKRWVYRAASDVQERQDQPYFCASEQGRAMWFQAAGVFLQPDENNPIYEYFTKASEESVNAVMALRTMSKKLHGTTEAAKPIFESERLIDLIRVALTHSTSGREGLMTEKDEGPGEASD